MKVDRAAFFPRARSSVFGGLMRQGEVDGINEFLDAYEKQYPAGDPRWLAYMLATIFHETAATMQPIAEYGEGHGLPYGVAVNGHAYYGRGYVQLTWLANYRDMSQFAGVDLVADPEEALRPDIAAKIMFYGMEHGTFTKHRLADYLTPTRTDFINCRRIINGLDRAAQIAGYAYDFLKAIGYTK